MNKEYHRLILIFLIAFSLRVALFISAITYFAIATGPVSFTIRYRLPIMPFMILFSCYGMIHLHGIFLDSRK
jgi:hypothetical protein